ncbi:MAG: MarR family transcriptional regulator [Acidimicrobiia bacterium]|nr:MarR family transcriptional regulator [Acidimicrobiia bacterium]
MSPSSDSFLTGYLPYLLRQADQTLSAPFYAVLTRYGVARSEWRVLAVLQELGELSVADLAVHALSPQPTVTHAVRRLEQQNLVIRTLGTHDKRQRFVSMTPTGATLTTSLMAEAKRLETDLLANAGDLSSLVQQLTDLLVAVESQSTPESPEATHAG